MGAPGRRFPYSLALSVLLTFRGGSSGETSHRSGTPVLEPGDRKAILNGAEIAYHVFGHGPPCIAFPGGPGVEWRYLRMPGVEKHLTMIYIEPIGTGGSARLADKAAYSRSRDVTDLEALRAHLGLDRVYLLGHSYGGFVVLEYAIGNPARVAGLILYDTAAADRDEKQWAFVEQRMKRFSERPWYEDAAAAWAVDTASTDEEAHHLWMRYHRFFFFDYDSRKADYDAALAPVRNSVDRTLGGTQQPFDVRPRLSSLGVPTLVIVGTADLITPAEVAEEIHRGISGSRLVVLERSGHFGHMEEPRAFAAAVATWLRSVKSH